MKIASSDLLFATSHSTVTQHTVKETLKLWVGDQRPDFEGRSGPGANTPRPHGDVVNLSTQGKATAEATRSDKAAEVDPEKELEKNPKTQLIRLMIEALTGKKIKLVHVENSDTKSPSTPGQAQPSTQNPGQRAGYGVEYDRHETYDEAENTSFSAQGIIQTADGKQIQFDLNLNMSREFHQEQNVSLRLGDAQKKDPLVINFGGTAAQLTDTKFTFDIDSDGKADQISFVGAGSGFLTLDANGDGTVNNGSELFGTQTGNGFAELARYDQDRNGWIDENDAVYSQLKVWTKDAQGNDSLTSLKDQGIGAISLGQAVTPFDVKDQQNSLQGQVKSTGVYVNENGTVGTVQQVDLAV